MKTIKAFNLLYFCYLKNVSYIQSHAMIIILVTEVLIINVGFSLATKVLIKLF